MLRTLLRVTIGFLAACLIAGLVTVLFVTTPAELLATPASEFPLKVREMLNLALKTATHSAVFALAFSMIASGIAEWAAIRALPYYLIAGAAIALLGFSAQFSSEVGGQPTILNSYALVSFLTSGVFAGLTYWFLSGRFSGRTVDDDEVLADRPISAAPARPRILVTDRETASDAASPPAVPPRERKSLGSALSERLGRGRSAHDDADTAEAGDDLPAPERRSFTSALAERLGRGRVPRSNEDDATGEAAAPRERRPFASSLAARLSKGRNEAASVTISPPHATGTDKADAAKAAAAVPGKAGAPAKPAQPANPATPPSPGSTSVPSTRPPAQIKKIGEDDA